MDAFKRETAARVKRNARRKYRRELKKILDNESAE